MSSFSCTGRQHLVLRHQQVYGPLVLCEISSPAASTRHHGGQVMIWNVQNLCIRNCSIPEVKMATSLKACATLQPTDLRYVVCELDIRSWEATSMLLWSIARTPAMPPIYNMVTDAAEMPQCPSTFQHDACCAGVWWWWSAPPLQAGALLAGTARSGCCHGTVSQHRW